MIQKINFLQLINNNVYLKKTEKKQINNQRIDLTSERMQKQLAKAYYPSELIDDIYF